MKQMRLIPAAALAAALSVSAPAFAADPAAPVVVELFTSQGCYSCPPAEKFLGDLSKQKTVLALEFHVDYWDDLVYGAAGKWKDPFSKPAYTQRQSGYNQRIRGRGNVYTPQMVIDGRLEAVGSRRLAVLAAMRRAESSREDRIDVRIGMDGERMANVTLSGGAKQEASVWVVRYLKEKVTEVRSGENKGKTLPSHNIVTELRKIGKWDGTDAKLAVSDFELKPGEGCAILVQDSRQGPVLGAAPCPAASS